MAWADLIKCSTNANSTDLLYACDFKGFGVKDKRQRQIRKIARLSIFFKLR
jgi:hypothetical protein